MDRGTLKEIFNFLIKYLEIIGCNGSSKIPVEGRRAFWKGGWRVLQRKKQAACFVAALLKATRPIYNPVFIK